VLKLSHELDPTDWWAHPNCNLILNYSGLSRRFLRQKLQYGKCISSLELAKCPYASFIRTDVVLLEVRNQKEECYAWSLVAITSRILTLKLTASLSWSKAFPRCLESLLDFLRYYMRIVHSQPSVLLGSVYHQVISLWFLWVLDRNHSMLIVPLYRQILPNTYHGAHSLLSHDVMISHATSCTQHLQSIQDNIIFHHANDHFSLEVLAQMVNVVLDFRTWECSFQFRASDRVRPRRSRDEAQHKRSHEAQPDSTRCCVAHTRKKKWHGWPRSLPFFNCPAVLPHMRSMSLSLFLVPPPSQTSGRDFF
jgi:hypothetical protein